MKCRQSKDDLRRVIARQQEMIRVLENEVTDMVAMLDGFAVALAETAYQHRRSGS